MWVFSKEPMPQHASHWITPLLALAAVAPARSQEPGDGPGKADLLDQLLEEFETGSDLEYGGRNAILSLHGFLQLEFRDADGDVSSFDLHHANLLFDVAVNEHTDARLEFEWEHGAGKVEMDQVFLDYHPWDAAGPSFILGRFYAPFGVERHVWFPPVNLAVTRPLVMREVVPGSWYESGAMVRYSAEAASGIFLVETALSNGLGPALTTSVRAARQEQDSNQNKMLSGRLGWSHASGFGVGLSGAAGKHDPAGTQSYRFLGADASLDLEAVQLVGEWVQSEMDDPAAPGDSRGGTGWYLQAYAPLVDSQGGAELGAFVRADSVDPDRDIRDSADRDAVSIGLRWVPAAHLSFKLEYQAVSHDHPGPHANGDTIWFEAVLDF